MSINKKQPSHIIAFAAGSFLTAWLLFRMFPGVLEVWSLRANDALFRLRYEMRGKIPVNPSIVHVDLDNASFQRLKGAAWKRTLYARLIRLLSDAHVSAIAYDIVFTRPADPEDERALVEATRHSGRVYYPVILPLRRYTQTQNLSPNASDENEFLMDNLWRPLVRGEKKALEGVGALTAFRELVQSSRGIGHITVYPDRDGIFRRFPLLVRYGDGYFPSLIFRLVCDYLHVAPKDIEVSFGDHIVLRGAELPEGRKQDITIPIDDQGRIIINFAGPWADSFPHYSFMKIIDAEGDKDLLDFLRDEMEGDLVVVSDVSTGSRDIGAVPMESIYPLSGLHTNIANAILTRNFIDELSGPTQALLNLFVVIVLCFFAYRFRALGFSLFTVLFFAAFLIACAWLFFYRNTMMDLVRPTLGFLFCLATINVYQFLVEERERIFLRQRFENYFAPEVLSKILRSLDKLQASEKKVLTVLFSDIAGFTSWCTTQEPGEIRSTLNEYFEEMTKIVFKHGGTIDKFIGDGLMVFFGDPLEHPDHALRAVKAAMEMQQKARELKERWQREGRMPIKIRIGIHTGEVIVGNMGSEQRMDYTVLGANVNLAQRLESNAPLEGILVSDAVYQRVKDTVPLEFSGKITAKGIKEEFGVYTITL